MRVVTPTFFNNQRTMHGRIVPPIPLKRPDPPHLVKGDYLAYKLRNDPADDTSPTYELCVPYFGTGSCEDWLKFRDNLDKVIVGQHVTTGPAKFVVARRLLTGDALSVFNAALVDCGLNETNQAFDLCLSALTRHVFPKRAAQLQKRYLRRYVRKPEDMTTKQFAARLQELNSYLPKFPTIVQDGEPVRKLEEDELVDIMENGVPRAWQRKMIEHDFDVVNASIHDFVDFCDRMESVEKTDDRRTDVIVHNSKNRRDRKNANRLDAKRPRDNKGNNHCLVHGNTGPNGHTSDKCKVLMASAKKLRLTYEDDSGKRHRFPDAIQEMNVAVDEHGTVRFGPKSDVNKKRKERELLKKKRGRSEQFEKDLQNLEHLSLSDESRTKEPETDESSSDSE